MKRVTGKSTPAKAASAKAKPAVLLGMAFDAEDGHKRLTRGPNFMLAGGSEGTHAVMQETAIKINEHLESRGQHLEDARPQDLRDICQKVAESHRLA